VIKWNLQRKELWDTSRFYPYVPYTTRDGTEGTRWRGGDWNAEAGRIVKYPSEYERSKHFASLIRSNSDWKTYFITHENNTLVNANK
jgi:hypothetical protein